MDGLSEQFGPRVKAARQARGLTQAELASKAELTRSSIANLEAGRQEVPVRVLAAIANALGETVASLLGEVPLRPLPDVHIVVGHAVVCGQCGPVAQVGDMDSARAERIAHVRAEHLWSSP